MPQTPIYSLRYPALTDQPNGPAQIGNLAADTEAGLVAVNGAASAGVAAAAVVVGGKRYVTGTALATTSSGTEILTATDTGAINYVNGQVYEVEWSFYHQLSIGTDVFKVRIRLTNTAGTIQVEDDLQNEPINQPLVKVYKFLYKPTVTGAATFVGTMSRVSGTGGLDSKASAGGLSYFKVTKLGVASTTITDV